MGKLLIFPSLRMMSAVGICKCSLSNWGSFCYWLIESFYFIFIWIFSKFFYLYWYDHKSFSNDEPFLHIWDISYFVIVYNYLYICWIHFANISLKFVFYVVWFPCNALLCFDIRVMQALWNKIESIPSASIYCKRL